MVAIFGPPPLDGPRDGNAASARRDDLAPGRDGFRHARALVRLPLAEWPVYLGERLHSTWVRIRYLRWRILMHLCAALRYPPPLWLRNAWQFITYAVRRHEARPAGARLLLLNTGEEGMQTDDELRAAWGPLALGGVEIRHVAGRHDTMFNPPHVFSAARELGAAVVDLCAARSNT